MQSSMAFALINFHCHRHGSRHLFNQISTEEGSTLTTNRPKTNQRNARCISKESITNVSTSNRCLWSFKIHGKQVSRLKSFFRSTAWLMIGWWQFDFCSDMKQIHYFSHAEYVTIHMLINSFWIGWWWWWWWWRLWRPWRPWLWWIECPNGIPFRMIMVRMQTDHFRFGQIMGSSLRSHNQSKSLYWRIVLSGRQTSNAQLSLNCLPQEQKAEQTIGFG